MRTYNVVRQTYDIICTYRHRMLRHRMLRNIRHHMLRCRTCLTYDINIRCRTCTTYDIVRVRCRTCTTYDMVCNIGFIRCRTSDVRDRTSARIQMEAQANSLLSPITAAADRSESTTLLLIVVDSEQSAAAVIGLSRLLA
jgi:hypothetical protein